MPNILFFLSFFRAFFFLFTKKAAAGFAGVCYYLSPTFHIEKHWNPIFFFTNLPLNPSIKLCVHILFREDELASFRGYRTCIFPSLLPIQGVP